MGKNVFHDIKIVDSRETSVKKIVFYQPHLRCRVCTVLLPHL